MPSGRMTLWIWLLLLLSNVASGKIFFTPEPTKPIVNNGIRYTASYVPVDWGPKTSGGYVEAWDTKTNKSIWKSRVYKTIKRNPQLEGDVQETFMSSFALLKAFLIVEAGGNKYMVEIKTGKVIQVKRNK